MKKWMIIIIVLITLIGPCILQAQLTDKQLNGVRADVVNVIKSAKNGTASALNGKDILARAELRTGIKQALLQGETGLALEYLNAYAAMMDSLVFTEPLAVKVLSDELKGIYKDEASASAVLDYYNAAALYFLGLYEAASENLGNYVERYTDTKYTSDALTLLLKSYLQTGKEEAAYDLIEKRGSNFNAEQSYLAGHICFALGKDAIAERYFGMVTGGKYSADAAKMIELLQVLHEDPKTAKEDLSSQLKNEASNPFLLLSLARLSAALGEWDEAEEYYSRYTSAAENYSDYRAQLELAEACLNAGNRQRAEEVLADALQNRQLSEYTGPFLYLWSEIISSEGRASEAETKRAEIETAVNNNIEILAEKKFAMERLSALRAGMSNVPDLYELQRALGEVKNVSDDLDSLNAILSKSPYGISDDSLIRWKVMEQKNILLMTSKLQSCLKAEDLRSVQDTVRIAQLAEIKASCDEQLKKIKAFDAELNAMNDQNLYLAMKNEIDANLEVWDVLIKDLYRIKTSGVWSGKLDTLLVSCERKQTEMFLLLDYYNYDNSNYRAIKQEVNLSKEQTQDLLNSIEATKVKYQIVYPKNLVRKGKTEVREELEYLPFSADAYRQDIEGAQQYLRSLKGTLAFLQLHIKFAENNYLERQRIAAGSKLTFAENEQLYKARQENELQLYSQLLAFTQKYENKSDELKPANPDFNIVAAAYFDIAELGNALEPLEWQKNLELYKRVLSFDPNFYFADVVFYNIGYLSSTIEKNRIEQGLIAYEEKNIFSLTKPENLRYSEAAYGEAINAYKAIVDNYPRSQYYSEALFRLGYLYFEIGTDAARPVQYYETARSYYDRLISRPADPYLYKALYQRGWTWLNSNSEEAYKQAINDFIAILKAIEEGAIQDSTEVVDYTVAATKNIGYCLIGMDGADTISEAKGAKYARDVLSVQMKQERYFDVLTEAADQKLKLYIPIQAIDFLQVKLEADPLSLNNPLVADSICALYKAYPEQMKRDLSADEAYYLQREKIINNYGIKSSWYEANKNKDITRQMEVLSKSYAELEKRYNNEFVDHPTAAGMERYSKLVYDYDELLKERNLPHSDWEERTEANIIAQNLKLARLSGNASDYLNLQAKIYKYNDKHPDNNIYLDLEGMAYNSARIVADSLKTDLVAMKNAHPDLVLPIADNDPASYFNQSAERFLRVLRSERYRSPEHDQMCLAVIMKQAELEEAKHSLEAANGYYKKVVDFDGNVTKEMRRAAFIHLAQNNETQKNYQEAERYYREAEKYALNDKDKALLHQYALLQIQNYADYSAAQGNQKEVGEAYLRLASDYAIANTAKSDQYKGKAQTAFKAAGEYDKSIELLTELAASKKKASEALNLYRLAWSLADSLNMDERSENLKREFISKYPMTLEAYQVRLTLIDKKASVPATAKQAGDMYLELYNDMLAKKVNYGSAKPSEIYLAAIAVYDQAGAEIEKEKCAEYFVKTYPTDPATQHLMEYLADKQLVRGDKTAYEETARTLFKKYPSNYSRYANIAKEKLRVIATEFDEAYAEKNWPVAMAKIDEFKKVHAAYTKEGLRLNFDPVYETFASAQAEYKEIQAKEAFAHEFAQTLVSIENGFLAKTPDELLRVNAQTKWNVNLAGGENRIQALINSAAAEIKKVKQLLEKGAQYELPVEDRLRCMDLIEKISDHAVEVLNVQMDKYMRVSNEFALLKVQYKNEEENLYSGFDNAKKEYTGILLQLAYPYNLALYRYFYLPGMHNQYTQNAYERLVRLNALPEYDMQEIAPDEAWQINYSESASPPVFRSYNQPIEKTRGQNYYSLTMPAESELIIKTFADRSIPAEYALFNLVSPYYADTKIMLNGINIEYTFNPIDTLSIDNMQVVRYALNFGEGKFRAGKNELELHLFNNDAKSLTVYCNLFIIYDLKKAGMSSEPTE